MQEAAKGKLPRDVGGGRFQASGCLELPSVLGLACQEGLCSQLEASHSLCEGTSALPLTLDCHICRRRAQLLPHPASLSRGGRPYLGTGLGTAKPLQGKWLVGREREELSSLSTGVKSPLRRHPAGGGWHLPPLKGRAAETPAGDQAPRPSPSQGTSLATGLTRARLFLFQA